MSQRVSPLEKKVIATAASFSVVLLALIAFAAIRLGVSVPSCVTNVKPFTAGSLIKVGDKRYEVHVLAQMWQFEPRVIRVPVGSTVDFYAVSKDVTHGFNINGTNVNLMVVPYVVNSAQAKFDRPGIYPVVCHEYCGAGHQAMNGVIEVRDDLREADADGLAPSSAADASVAANAPTVESAAVHPGRQLIDTKGCIACHSVDGRPGVAPTFKGLWSKKEEMSDGTSVVVDAAYVRESIQQPMKKVVKGFSPVMPTLPVNDAEIDRIIDYLKTIK